MTERSSNWSITINNPTEEETGVQMPTGWKLSGQYEQGENGTTHFQGMLKTPQVRFSAVKSIFPRAHIEVARNVKALEKYVHKEETRVGEFAGRSVPTIFEYQAQIASKWDDKQFSILTDDFYRDNRDPKRDLGDVALSYVDSICAKLIEEGARGLEFISVNPMWRSSWKKFYSSIIKRQCLAAPAQPSVSGLSNVAVVLVEQPLVPDGACSSNTTHTNSTSSPR